MKGKNFLADRILNFIGSLSLPGPLPPGVQVLNPYHQNSVMELCKKFYHSYYHDNSIRRIIIGINPGRLGGGLTGIPFTDPVHLEKCCHIKNDLQKKTELSSTFIYEMIAAYGGPKNFYSAFYFGAVSPLGFTREKKNLNYYDDKRLQKKLESFILNWMQAQLDFGLDRRIAYCLGEGENFKYLKQVNDEHLFFKEIIPLSHPRFIMQYKSKSKRDYIHRYLDAFNVTPEKDAS